MVEKRPIGMGWPLCVVLPWDDGAGPRRPPLMLRSAAAGGVFLRARWLSPAADLPWRGAGL